MTNRRDCWIVIPAYNEATVISGVVAGVRAIYDHVVVVDDCSIDRTGDYALQCGAVVLRHPINLGQGAALQTGFDYALSRGAELLVTFDADGQHRVEDIAALLEVRARVGVDVVTGSRFLGAAENLPRSRRAVLKAAAAFTRLTSGLALTDAHNGMRLLTRKAALLIRIRQNRMAHASEILQQARVHGLSIAEAPVTIIYTEYSLMKGQKLGNAFNILSEIYVAILKK